MQVFVIDSWHEIKEDRQIIFLKQLVCSSGDVVQIQYFPKKKSVSLSESFFHLIDFPGYALRGLYFNWLVLLESLSP